MNPVDPIRDLGKLDQLKRNLRAKSPRDYLLVVLGLNTALRVSDLLPLRILDVTDEGGKVLDYLYVREKKTHKPRKITLNTASQEAIAFYLEQEKPTGNAPLFRSPNTGKPISRVQAWRILNDAARKVGIRDRIGTHSLRKSWGFHARQQGVSIELIQEKLGHSSPSVTRRYIGVTQEEVEEVERRVNL